MSILKLIVIIIILYILWKIFTNYMKEGLVTSGSDVYEDGEHPALYKEYIKYYNDLKNYGGTSYDEMIKYKELDTDTVESHYRDMVREGPKFSSGASYALVEPDNTSPTFNSFTGLFRPEYVPILPGARQLPSENIDELKKNKRRNVWNFIPGGDF